MRPTINKKQKYFSLTAHQLAENLSLVFGFYEKIKQSPGSSIYNLHTEGTMGGSKEYATITNGCGCLKWASRVGEKWHAWTSSYIYLTSSYIYIHTHMYTHKNKAKINALSVAHFLHLSFYKLLL